MVLLNSNKIVEQEKPEEELILEAFLGRCFVSSATQSMIFFNHDIKYN